MLLTELLARIDAQANFTQDQIRRTVVELVKITASYRPTWFFQATYGQTSSAQALLQLMKDPKFNTVLPLSNIVFGVEVDCAHLKDEEIIGRFQSMQRNNQWQESSEDILRLLNI